jgi:hypothetical protein
LLDGDVFRESKLNQYKTQIWDHLKMFLRPELSTYVQQTILLAHCSSFQWDKTISNSVHKQSP